MAGDARSTSLKLRETRGPLWVLLTGLGSLAYAVLRYNVFKGVPWEHLPLYVVNKAVAVSAVALLASSYLTGKRLLPAARDPAQRRIVPKFLGLCGFSAAGLHAVLSLALLSPAYYPKLFGGERMTFAGEVAVLAGALGLLWMAAPALGSLPNMEEALGRRWWQRAQRGGYLALAMAAAHTAAMGLPGWFRPGEWPGRLPPITLIGFLIAALTLAARLWRASGPPPGA